MSLESLKKQSNFMCPHALFSQAPSHLCNFERIGVDGLLYAYEKLRVIIGSILQKIIPKVY